MFLVLNQLKRLKTQMSVVQISQYLLLLMVGVIVALALMALYRPISNHNFLAIQSITQQENYPNSQKIALSLLNEPQINMAQYLKLMHVYQYEAQREKTLAPYVVEQ